MAVSTVLEERLYYESCYLHDKRTGTLLLRRFVLRETPKGRRILRVNRGVQFFRGATLDEAEDKMAEWIEQSGAEELPVEDDDMRWVPEDMAEQADSIERLFWS